MGVWKGGGWRLGTSLQRQGREEARRQGMWNCQRGDLAGIKSRVKKKNIKHFFEEIRKEVNITSFNMLPSFMIL
jgi:hypothetical protein